MMGTFGGARGNSPWTEERDERLKLLVAEGLSASMIAAEIREPGKFEPSRNAVIGRVHRLNIGKIGGGNRAQPVRRGPSRPQLKGATSEATLSKQMSSHAAGAMAQRITAGRHMTATAMPAVAGKAVKGSCPVPFAELEAHHCRYPLGNPYAPVINFCGAHRLGFDKRHPGEAVGPYCFEHAMLCFNGRPDFRERAPDGRARNGRHGAFTSFRAEAAE